MSVLGTTLKRLQILSVILFSLQLAIYINNLVFTFEATIFFHDFWAMWYIKTVCFSHEIKLGNADLVFKLFIFCLVWQLFLYFLKYFAYPRVSGKILWIHVFQSISLSVHICPSVNRFYQESLVRLFDFWMVTDTKYFFLFKLPRQKFAPSSLLKYL